MRSFVRRSGRHSVLKFLLLSAFVMSAYVVALAEDATPKDTDAEQKEVLTTLEQRMQKRISVDFRNTPIDDVIRIMAEQADVDIVKSPKVVGNVTTTLTDVPLEEALNNILAAHGYGYVATKNMIRIAPIAEITERAETLVSRIYRITYADVKEVEGALKKFISKQGSLSANPGTSNIIVTDTDSKIKAIDTFIAEIDRMTPQILVEARVYDISSTDRLDLGVEWQIGRNTNYGTDGVGVIGGQTGATSTLVAPGNTDPHVTGAFDATLNKATDTTGLIRFGILNEALNIDTIIRAEQENISAKLLANPRVMVLDNEEALIKIIEEIPYQELTETAAGGSIGTTEFKEVGVELMVIPHVTRDNMVRLKLKPKFSVQTGEVYIAGVTEGISPQPVVATREADTTALIKDGQTVVIGGLRKQDASQQTNKVPLLGDIPLVGALFRFEGEKIVNSELVVFITPHIIEEPVLSTRELKHFEDTEVPTPKSPTIRLGQGEEEQIDK